MQESLERLGHAGVTVDAVGRTLSMTVDCESAEEAEQITERLCHELLVNPNLETYSVAVGEMA
ncbi:MAG TPA: phosphoribosylformylglycinamidine synthase subunit PurS [Acidimicrobiia bacterium]|nr:phosphoribosylformylglycinamidine synthase subunit PurS [Acidimicrobiia bacterium]